MPGRVRFQNLVCEWGRATHLRSSCRMWGLLALEWLG